MTSLHTTNGKGHGCDPVPFQRHTINELHYHTGQRPGKPVETLKAKFALAGHQVHEGSNDDFIVTRWGMSRYCADIGALRRFARVVGVNHG